MCGIHVSAQILASPRRSAEPVSPIHSEHFSGAAFSRGRGSPRFGAAAARATKQKRDRLPNRAPDGRGGRVGPDGPFWRQRVLLRGTFSRRIEGQNLRPVALVAWRGGVRLVTAEPSGAAHFRNSPATGSQPASVKLPKFSPLRQPTNIASGVLWLDLPHSRPPSRGCGKPRKSYCRRPSHMKSCRVSLLIHDGQNVPIVSYFAVRRSPHRRCTA
jgi:hypothetical protein